MATAANSMMAIARHTCEHVMESLTKKTPKKGDQIEYDSDPEHKEKDKNKSHIHKGKIIKIDDNKNRVLMY